MPNNLIQTARLLWLAALLCCASTDAADAQSLEQPMEQNMAARTISERAVGILKTRCIACHGSEKNEGGLRLDSLEHVLRGGDRGTAIRVGQAGESLLVESLRGTDDDLHMPPKDSLSSIEIEAIEQWIQAGALWPMAGDSPLPGSAAAIGNAWEDANNPIRKLFQGERLELWSLRPIVKPTVPWVERAGAGQGPAYRARCQSAYTGFARRDRSYRFTALCCADRAVPN
jgi:Planctomycete cytochrome C